MSRVLPAGVLVLLCVSHLRAADPFETKVVPFLNTYCIQCHNDKTTKGELNLTRYPTAVRATADFRQWEHVLTFLKKEEMPPAKAKQPTSEARAEVMKIVEQMLLKEALKLAGDPGVVPARRLSNAEYDNTIQDLTGKDIRPAQSFPVDPASGEGFTNTGEALTMSPALFKKYYAAAEFVGDHALLTPSGMRFAPHPVVTFADRQKYYEQAILRFYERHAVDYEKYLVALWLYRHRPEARKTATLEDWAGENALSAVYLRSLWTAVQGNEPADKFLLHWLRQRWDALPKPRSTTESDVSGEVRDAVRLLVADLQQLSKHLCPVETPAIVSNAGNGPVEHLARRRLTAVTRDTPDKTALGNTRFQTEFRNITEKETIKLVVVVGAIGSTKADGYLTLNGTFTTTAQTNDGKKKWSLREILADHAPDELKKLQFGKHPKGDATDADALVVALSGSLEVEIPTKAFALKNKGNITFTAECKLDRSSSGVALVRVLDRKPEGDALNLARPLLDPKHEAAREFESSAVAFCRLFPSRFFYVDSTRGLSAGFHLIEGFFRDDRPLYRHVLTATERKELDRLWDELYFGTDIWEKMLRGFVFFERSERNFLKHPDFDGFKEEDPDLVKDEVLQRFKEVYLKRANVKLTGDELANHPISIFFDDIRAGLRRRGETFKASEATYLKELKAFAASAYRRPLTDQETQKLERFYTTVCREKEHGTEAAVRATIVRTLVSLPFCFRFDPAPPGDTVAPLPDLALASRLSYLLWASMPDEELLSLARQNKLHEDRVLREQVRRMLKDPRVSRFAQEFFGQWLGYRDFLTQETVNRQVFPGFDDALRQSMFEEPTRLATHLIQRDRPITELINGDSTFVNKKLAQHYGLTFREQEGEWQRVEGLHERGRSGVLGMAVILTKNSQPQRTSPVKRGFWVVHKLLGEHIPPPPPDVAVLPAKESDTEGKTIRQLMVMHTTDMKCAACHQRFDPVGLSMEGFDPIGRSRTKDLAGRPVDNVVKLPTGKEARGVPEFAAYLVDKRTQDFTHTLCQKFLGYALGRSLQLSDQPLLEKMEADLAANEYHLSRLFELVAVSPQFRNQRCRDFTPSRFKPELKGAEK